MLCSSCSKLSFLFTNRKCVKCHLPISSNILVLCDTCSTNDKVCGVCMKKLSNPTTTKYHKGGCGVCGK